MKRCAMILFAALALGFAACDGTASAGTLTVPADVTCIAEEAFRGDRTVTAAVLPEGLETIGERAFASTGLTEIDLPSSLVLIADDAFEDTPVRATARRGTYAAGWAAEKGLLSWEWEALPDGTAVVTACGLTASEITVPDEIAGRRVSGIGGGAFAENGTVRSVAVPPGIISIGEGAFLNCARLESVTLTSDVVSIHETAFSGCPWTAVFAPEGSAAAEYAAAHGLMPEDAVLESPHPYTEDGEWEYECGGDAVAMLVTFSEKTYFHGVYGVDCLTVLDAEGGAAEYGEDRLAGVTLLLPGNSFSLHLDGYYSRGTDFGFRVTRVLPLDQAAYDAYMAALEANPWVTAMIDCGLEITEYLGQDTEVTVPSAIDGTPVLSVGEGAFAGNERLTRVTVGEGIAVIGAHAFDTCLSLEEIVLPDTVSVIGPEAFIDCAALTAFAFPESVAQIADGVLFGCGSLQSVSLPQGTETIGNYAFSLCASLTEIALPDGLTEIGEGAFADTGLTEVSVPGGVAEIPEAAFMGCLSLSRVTLPSSVLSIGAYAFHQCPIAELVLPEGLETLGSFAFGESCLTAVRLPNSLEDIAPDAFRNSALLTSITVDTDNSNFTVRDGMVLDRNGNTLVFCANGLAGALLVPEGVARLGEGAVSGMPNVTSVELPESMASVGAGNFADCPCLTDVVIPAEVTVIEGGRPRGSSGLVIHAPAGSCAYEWAQTYGIPVAEE